MLKIFVDGSCSSNSRGKTGVGVVVKENDETKEKISESTGKGTNNTAEYQAVIKGLERARELGEDKVMLFSDSQLVVKQLNGKYKIKQEHLEELWREVQELLKDFEEVSFSWIPREKNWLADKLAKKALEPGKKRKVEKSSGKKKRREKPSEEKDKKEGSARKSTGRDLEQVLFESMGKDDEYRLQWHRLASGEEADEHVHQDLVEIAIIGEGEYEVRVDDKKKSIEIDEGWKTVRFPAGASHGLKNVGENPVKYFVVRKKT